ncbi:ATP-binding protein [Aquihabitans sp. G128]|uniref:ATP-binding protein n=1 Tax=Aquihabitans sp. G128 TaxID=2849779 RepID=UPI001C2271DC|nr:ATP-binding protein [Aquihabitans sp. G128]QXC61122.1 ATP-binding protein [Aquihabitans sp. G128]
MGQPEDPEDVRIDLPAEATSAAEARAFVAAAVSRWGLEPPDALPLLTSEVVTNAVVHTESRWVQVRVQRTDGRVRVEVTDTSDVVPLIRKPDPESPGGFGMWLVAQLARDWGVDEIAEDGKVVWFELALAPT